MQVAYLSVVGGKSEKDTIERVLAATISDDVALKFNWNGLKGKQPFKSLKMCAVQ